MLTPFHPYQFVKVANFETYEDLVNSYYNPTSAFLSPTLMALGGGLGALAGSIGSPRGPDNAIEPVGGAVLGATLGGALSMPATAVLKWVANTYGLPSALRLSRTLGGIGVGGALGLGAAAGSRSPLPMLAAPLLGGIAGYYAGDIESRLRGLPTREEFEQKKKKKKKK